MEAIFLKLVNMSITASWLVLAIIVVRLIFKKAPKWILCLLWGLVAFRLICPFSIESAMSLIPSAEPLPQEIIYKAEPQVHSGVPMIDNTANPVLESSMAPAELTSANPTQIWSFILAQAWILGVCLMLAYAFISFLLIKRRVAAAIPLRQNIKRCEFIESPFVLGFIFPVIYLPAALDKTDWDYVIAHEEAHIQRKDHWWKPIGFLLLSIYWFNPIMWVAYVLLCRDIEAACDEKVIRNMDKEELRAYSTALLKSAVPQRSITACPLAFGEVGIKERIKFVMNYRKPSFWIILISVILILFLSITLLTNPEKEYDPDKIYPQSILKEPDRILVDVSGTDRVYEKDSPEYRSILESLRTNWWKYTLEETETASDSVLVAPAAPELLKTTTWETYVENSTTIICFQYAEHPILWVDADGDQTLIETIGFVLPDKTYSQENTRGYFLLSKTDSIGVNEGLYTYYYPPEIANNFWDFVQNARLNHVTSVSGRTLSLNDVITLSHYGDDLLLSHFMGYAYEEQGDPLLYTRKYPINDDWYLRIHHGGGLEKPIAVWLTHAGTRKHVDITQGNENNAITDFITNLNPEYAQNIICIDIWTRKQVCLSSKEKIDEVLKLMHDLENNAKPASGEEIASKQKDTFLLSNIVVNYELGRKTIYFSENFDYAWEAGSDVGVKIKDPVPLREFITSVTSGVRNHDVSGEPFATMDAPWDWCSGLSTSAAESAQVHVCLSIYNDGNRSGSTSTNGWISFDTLESLVDILNDIPKDAFVPDKTISRESYRSFFINQQVPNSAVSVIDGVNDIAVAINYQDGKVTMLLTDEMEKVRDNMPAYLEPTQLWLVEDQTLTDFMASIAENPPIINYSVGAEYEWQTPLDFQAEGFSLELRLPEGWEYEYVENTTDSGIRCRPDGITDGWIYFSYWPGEYKPVEKDRYIVEGFYFDWATYTSYADKDVRIPGGMSTYGKIWSYERYDLEIGDYAIINDGADAWFTEYKDLIQAIRTLSNITVD